MFLDRFRRKPKDIYHEGWKQVRIYSHWEHSILWYPYMLNDLIAPVFSKHPDVPMFFSKYCIPIGTDDGDTGIKELPEGLIYKDSAISVRFRFKGNEKIENFITNTVDASNGDYWFSDIRDYNFLGDLGSYRFCSDDRYGRRVERSKLIADLLKANCSIILDSIVYEGGNYRFEKNSHKESAFVESSFISLAHMMGQAWLDHKGHPIPVYLAKNMIQLF